MRDKSRGGDINTSRMGGNDREKKSSMRTFPSESAPLGNEPGRFNPED